MTVWYYNTEKIIQRKGFSGNYSLFNDHIWKAGTFKNGNER